MDNEHEDPGIKSPRNGTAALGGLVPKGTVPSVKCRAHRSNGQPCGRWAIVGGTVCPTHGGSAPQVRAAALQRILSEADNAVATLVRNMGGDAPPSVQVRAADSLLDRAGLKAADVQVHLTEDVERPDLGAAMAKVLQARGLMDVIDVDPVDSTDDPDDEG